jgi:hypothetical protein
MPNVQNYKVTKAASYETATPAGAVAFDFKAGDVTPKSDAEAAALEALVAAGCAERVTAKPAPTKPSKVEE